MHFVVDGIDQWETIGGGEIIAFDKKFRGARKVKVSFNTNADVEVFAGRLTSKGKVDQSSERLVAASRGLFHVSFAVEGEGYFYVAAPKDARVEMRNFAQDMSVKRRDVIGYTNVEPRQRRNSDLDRLMQLMRMNDLARDQKFEEMARSNRELAAALKSQKASDPVIDTTDTTSVDTSDATTDAAASVENAGSE